MDLDHLGIGTCIALSGLITGIVGFSTKPEADQFYLEGVVEKEYCGGSTYVLQIKTSEGVYTASVFQDGYKTLAALSLAIEKGDSVRFLKTDNKDYAATLCAKAKFDEDRIGYVYSSEIKVLGK